MCSHDEFDVIYYKNGVMLRRCKHCGSIELRLDWNWHNIEEIRVALDTVEPKAN